MKNGFWYHWNRFWSIAWFVLAPTYIAAIIYVVYKYKHGIRHWWWEAIWMGVVLWFFAKSAYDLGKEHGLGDDDVKRIIKGILKIKKGKTLFHENVKKKFDVK